MESSIKPQVKVRDHPRPAIRLVADEGGELLRRAAYGIVAGARGFFSQRGVGQNARDLGVDLGDDRRRRAARGDEAEPHRDVRKVGQPRGLAERRDIGHGGRRRASKPRERAHCAAFDHRGHDHVGGVDEIDAPREQPVDRVGRALERHIDDVEPSGAMKEMPISCAVMVPPP